LERVVTKLRISGQLKQDHAQESLTGQFAFVISCDGTTDWTATVLIAPTLFEGRAADLFVAGRADITASASALDQDTGGRRTATLPHASCCVATGDSDPRTRHRQV
jgi:hypothetical protein